MKIEYLAADNKILRSQINGRLRFTDAQRITLAMLGKKLGQKLLKEIASIVTPETHTGEIDHRPLFGQHARVVPTRCRSRSPKVEVLPANSTQHTVC